MICVAVFEPDPGRKATIKEWLVRYTVQRNCEIELLWFSDVNPAAKLEKHASHVQIALIGLDHETGAQTGALLYSQNPDCRILYYCAEDCELEPLLPSRPIDFFLWSRGRDSFLKKLDAVYEDVRLSPDTFRYETKNAIHLLPKRSILYFRSDLRYVDVCLQDGRQIRLMTKLSRIEELAAEPFVRIHKSYLVNGGHVACMDKKNRCVLLTNGETLPVSEAQYGYACSSFRAAES